MVVVAFSAIQLNATIKLQSISSSSTEDSDANSALILPHISTFDTNPTDQFLVSMNVVADGRMYRGENADNLIAVPMLF